MMSNSIKVGLEFFDQFHLNISVQSIFVSIEFRLTFQMEVVWMSYDESFKSCAFLTKLKNFQGQGLLKGSMASSVLIVWRCL